VIEVPQAALAFGFANAPAWVLTSRTIMLAELRQLLAACPPASTAEDYRAAVVAENVLLKRTGTTRAVTFRWLRTLYGLDPAMPLFRALRDLWTADENAQPLIALLCAAAREPLLRRTAAVVLATPVGEPVTPTMLADSVREGFPDRYGGAVVGRIGKNLASSWLQAGHLRGRVAKVRTRAASHPAAVAYALLLRYLCDARGEALFETLWCRLLDAPVHGLHEQAVMAARLGWIEYRRAGQVTDVEPRYLLRNTGQEARA
jgi:hypothetical protein